METKQIDNKDLILYSPDSLKFITDDLEKILKNSKKIYKNLFNVKEFRKIRINYFDDIEKFRNFVYSIRKEEEPLPKYAEGTFDEGMINAYINPNIIIGSNMFYRKNIWHPMNCFILCIVN